MCFNVLDGACGLQDDNGDSSAMRAWKARAFVPPEPLPLCSTNALPADKLPP